MLRCGKINVFTDAIQPTIMLIPVILSGGAGTRRWPVSREGHPKPFMKRADGESLLLKTYRRAAAVALANERGGEILAVTNRDYFFMSKDELARAQLDEQQTGVFLLEPVGRNTAPAVALAAYHVANRFGREEMMLVLAPDHLIMDKTAFGAAVAEAASLAEQDKLVTFGILPLDPETGFGYIEPGDVVGKGKRVVRFVEKPSLQKAEEDVAAGNFLLNSGMFCFKAGTILDEMVKHVPDLATAAEACWAALCQENEASDTMLEISAESFGAMPDISIDYAISELVKPNGDNNRAVGQAIFVDTKNTFVQNDNRMVATVGIDNLMIVDTPDALPVAHTDEAQNVKKIVVQLKKRNHEAHKLHRTVARPWGGYTVPEEGPRFKIKRIELRPGGCLSLQTHHHRSEHWIDVCGIAKVLNGDQEIFIGTNQSAYIPAGHQHRLENPGVVGLVMIEEQSGEYLGEDDIVRFQDIYGSA